MKIQVYDELADALNLLPLGFPRTKSGIELKMLKKIFSPEEARVASNMTRESETIETIAARANLPVEKTGKLLRRMTDRGATWSWNYSDTTPLFRLAPLTIGLLDEMWDRLDPDFCQYVREYMLDGGAEGLFSIGPAVERVVPIQRAVKPEQRLPYDDLKSWIMKANYFELRDCICRNIQEHLGQRKCDYDIKNCLTFSPNPAWHSGLTVTNTSSREEYLEIFDRAEEEGLMHLRLNIAGRPSYICNCCGCCCTFLLGITDPKLNIPNAVAKSNYLAVVDADKCDGCGICQDRCQVNACTVDGVATIDLDKCMGCGVCVVGCPNNALSLELKPESDIVHPPEDYKVWEQMRLKNRGLL